MKVKDAQFFTVVSSFLNVYLVLRFWKAQKIFPDNE